jgi:hydrogenase maturation factor
LKPEEVKGRQLRSGDCYFFAEHEGSHSVAAEAASCNYEYLAQAAAIKEAMEDQYPVSRGLHLNTAGECFQAWVEVGEVVLVHVGLVGQKLVDLHLEAVVELAEVLE